MPTLILKTDRASIWQIGNEWFVYAGDRLARVCPSIGMAREIAAGL